MKIWYSILLGSLLAIGFHALFTFSQDKQQSTFDDRWNSLNSGLKENSNTAVILAMKSSKTVLQFQQATNK